jgi:hypothetical protein
VATHKFFSFPDDSGYIPIHVGKAASDLDLGIIGDNTGDHISELNPYFCELTGLYWLWKNASAPITGLVHYRRYFAPLNHSVELESKSIAASIDFNELHGKYDLIIGPPSKFYFEGTTVYRTVEQQYCDTTIGIDLVVTRKAIEFIDSSYLDYWDFIMRGSTMSIANMMIGKREAINRYCQWLFPVLFHVKDLIPYSDYGSYEKRVFGFLAERLMNVWIAKNRNTFRVCYRDFTLMY